MLALVSPLRNIGINILFCELMDKTDMVLTTLENLPGMDIEEHIGLVSGNAVFVQSFFKGLLNGLKSILGGELKDFDAAIQATRNEALNIMINQARNLGSNAVINIRFENSRTEPNFTEVYVYGTAVKANKY